MSTANQNKQDKQDKPVVNHFGMETIFCQAAHPVHQVFLQVDSMRLRHWRCWTPQHSICGVSTSHKQSVKYTGTANKLIFIKKRNEHTKCKNKLGQDTSIRDLQRANKSSAVRARMISRFSCTLKQKRVSTPHKRTAKLQWHATDFETAWILSLHPVHVTDETRFGCQPMIERGPKTAWNYSTQM